MITTQQRNANCVVQASQLNGGNLSQFFNLQAMRIVKGQVILPNSSNSTRQDLVVINNYDGSAIQLGTSDIVISAIIENSSPEFPITSVNSTSFILGSTSVAPIYNSATSKWEWHYGPGIHLKIISPVSLYNVNSGVKLNADLRKSTDPNVYVILSVVSANGNVSFSSVNPAVNITLLVMNTI